eukprot:SAG11_NODE_830_length_6956_cov_11.233484_3_plen_47_part_00
MIFTAAALAGELEAAAALRLRIAAAEERLVLRRLLEKERAAVTKLR